MYLNYIKEVGFNIDVTELSRASVGKQTKFTSSTGITKGVADVTGLNVFGLLKYESGVHRWVGLHDQEHGIVDRALLHSLEVGTYFQYLAMKISF